MTGQNDTVHDDHHVTPRLRRDGSIDTGYYLRRSRKLRSEQAFALVTPRKTPTRRRTGWFDALFRVPGRSSA